MSAATVADEEVIPETPVRESSKWAPRCGMAYRSGREDKTIDVLMIVRAGDLAEVF